MPKSINESVDHTLNTFITNKKIPNIVFHGPNGSGKHSILKKFINNIYLNKEKISKYVLYVNCSHGKGIKFIREDLKFFSKSNINTNEGNVFKSIILLNADKLTIDAQSALRRCIESFAHTTRFFIIIDDKNHLLKPILSRFCEIFVPMGKINNNEINLHKQHNYLVPFKIKRAKLLEKILSREKNNFCDINNLAIELYNNGFSGLDLINYIENTKTITEEKKI